MADPAGLPLTVTQAVNALLAAVNLREVSTVNDTPDSFAAYRALDIANTRLQSKGWFCNSEGGIVFVRNAGPTPPLNTVTIPAQHLIVRPTRGGNMWPKYLTVRATITSGYKLLYSLTDHTSVFTVDPQLDVISALDFTDLPPALRWYIVCHAGRVYMPQTYPTPEFYAFSEAVEVQAAADAAHEDEILRDGALYETSPHFRGMRQR